MPLSAPAVRHVRIMIQVFGLLDPAGVSSPSTTRINRPAHDLAGCAAPDRLANALQIWVPSGRPLMTQPCAPVPGDWTRRRDHARNLI